MAPSGNSSPCTSDELAALKDQAERGVLTESGQLVLSGCVRGPAFEARPLPPTLAAAAQGVDAPSLGLLKADIEASAKSAAAATNPASVSTSLCIAPSDS